VQHSDTNNHSGKRDMDTDGNEITGCRNVQNIPKYKAVLNTLLPHYKMLLYDRLKMRGMML